MSNLGLDFCNYPLSLSICHPLLDQMDYHANIYLLIKTIVPWPINCSGYIFLCIVRAEFEEVIFFHCFYFLASLECTPMGLLPPEFPSKPFSLQIPAKFKTMFKSLTNLTNRHHLWSPLPATSSFSFCNFGFLNQLFLFSPLFQPSESGFLNLCTNDNLNQIILLWGFILWIVECLAACLSSPHYIPVAHTHTSPVVIW